MVESDAWGLAADAARAAGVELRPLTTLEDADSILRVMVATWGEHQLVPREMIRALADSGNVPYGAVKGGELVGYVLGWMALDADGPHVHSHMLAVLPDLRSGGVGLALKLAQRAQALEAGYRVVRWTFDPLQARNANFNLNKLGTVCDRFHRNFYGRMADAINRGDRSDRLVVRWDLEAPLGPRPIPLEPGPTLIRSTGRPESRSPESEEPSAATNARAVIPSDYPELKARDPDLAQRWRDAVGEVLEACFGLGMIVTGFVRGRGGGDPQYVLASQPPAARSSP